MFPRQQIASLALSLFVGVLSVCADEAPARPNIVFILIDDMGCKDAGCYGATNFATPHVDRLASQGMRFTSAYAAPVCSPTRASLMTGKHPARVHITNFIPQIGRQLPTGKLIPPNFDHALSLHEKTLAESLHAGGYQNAMIGKWHLGEEQGPEYRPQNRGFDHVVLSQHHGIFNYFYPFVDQEKWPYAGPLPGKAGDYLPDRLTDEAIEFVRENRENPFFLYLSHWSVHGPYFAPEKLVAKYRERGLEERPAIYAAMMETVDNSVGRLMATLDELKLTDKTLFIFMSDNGGERITSMAPLRGSKGSLYEGGVRVPLVVRYPGVVPQGSTCDVPVISHDLFPTLLDVAGVTYDADQLDGVSIAGLLTGKQTSLDREALYWHFPHYWGSTRPCGAIRKDDWKLVEHFETGRCELYDLKSDPGEQHDLADDMPQQTSELRDSLAQWRKRVNAQMPTRP
ncbi:sulfatase [Blastopirellula sp. JC732]|uniref:Sulfatase n=1 Tax=Blastopirellula sediminis TaxID=2894196 RepID=A0A9X1MMM6_9BACT|nr:sulfatase [Blastopirellula sediminis]MCC9608944.1 sulfatase [Blastopirellula sediminis]MCC9628279.1 sulfatase [Blastopirellula sediminis]